VSVIAFITAVYLASSYIPSVCKTILMLRCGAIDTMHDNEFFKYRVAADQVAILTGSLFWGAFFSSIVVGGIIGLVVFLFLVSEAARLFRRMIPTTDSASLLNPNGTTVAGHSVLCATFDCARNRIHCDHLDQADYGLSVPVLFLQGLLQTTPSGCQPINARTRMGVSACRNDCRPAASPAFLMRSCNRFLRTEILRCPLDLSSSG